MDYNFFSTGNNAIASALSWLQSILLGTIATAIAITTIASIGVLMLIGHFDVRRAAQAALGCFIIFGASTIASGILSASSGSSSPDLAQAAPLTPPLPRLPAAAQMPSTPYDPYASAAYLPPR